MKNSADAFGKIGKVWHTDELAELSRMEAYSMSIDAQINSVSDDVIYYYADAFSGLGGRVDMDVNLENREIGMMASARMGKTELATAMFSMEDEMLYLGVPDFLDDFYGVNTETLMRDLEDMGLDVGEAADISINLFDLIEIVQKYAGDTEEMRQELTAAITGLTKEITVEKAGKEMVKVGGESLKCQGYTVTIPQDALEGLVDVILDQADKDPMDMMEEIFESMSLPGEITEELMDELRYEYEYSQLDYDAVYDFLDVIGDLELQVYLKSNKVAGIVYEEKFDGTKLEIGLYAGGDQYGNSLKLELKVDGEKLTVESEGDHFAKSGVFTDKLTVKPPYGGSMKLETEYEPKSGELALSCSIAELKFKAEGTYAVTGSSYALALDEISLSDSGEEMLSVAFSWEIIEYAKRVRVSDARMITDLDDTDLENLMQELEGNAMEWAMKLTASHPELLEYLGIY